MLAQCPSCSAQIPNDGNYCDTCGKPLIACPACGALGKDGERCPRHQVFLVNRTHPPKPKATIAPPRRLRLVVTSGHDLAPLEVDADTVLGRGEGPFASLLDLFHDRGVSRRHCQFRLDPKAGWTVVDLAGRNSTWLSQDGRFTEAALAPTSGHAVQPGRDHLRTGQLTFKIEGIP